MVSDKIREMYVEESIRKVVGTLLPCGSKGKMSSLLTPWFPVHRPGPSRSGIHRLHGVVHWCPVVKERWGPSG